VDRQKKAPSGAGLEGSPGLAEKGRMGWEIEVIEVTALFVHFWAVSHGRVCAREEVGFGFGFVFARGEMSERFAVIPAVERGEGGFRGRRI
jgi:hypothetical protein